MQSEQVSAPLENFAYLYDVDVKSVLTQLEQHPDLFGSVPLRTSYEGSAHKEVQDILLRGPQITSEKTLSDLQHEVHCVNYNASRSLSEAYELCLELMYIARGTQLGRIIITKLPPGGKIYPHVDEGVAAEFYDRYHIVLNGSNGNIFTSGFEEVEMLTGQVWYINNHITHSVTNNSAEDRVHLICDIRNED
jgi:hypothetical protein